MSDTMIRYDAVDRRLKFPDKVKRSGKIMVIAPVGGHRKKNSKGSPVFETSA